MPIRHIDEPHGHIAAWPLPPSLYADICHTMAGFFAPYMSCVTLIRHAPPLIDDMPPPLLRYTYAIDDAT